MWMRMHVQTSGCTLTPQPPVNNAIRTAFQALAAVLGGTQSLHTNSFDEALCLPTEEAVTVALRTQQLIAHESGVTDTIDPLGGSYFIEALTDEMEERAMSYIDKIDSMGGVISGIEKGFFQKEIADSAYKYQKEVERHDRTVVGMNDYTVEKDWVPVDLLRIPPHVEREQLARLERVREGRNRQKVKQSLDKLFDDADKNRNLMPTIVEALKAYSTIGEITDVLRSVYGEYRELIIV
jgi:methylmalonyl-CoA mutase N-terminal domain/subunit